MSMQDRKRIIDYIFSRPDVSEDIRRHFEQWMLARENEAEIDEILQQMWNEHSACATDEENRKGLERLHAAIRPSRFRILGRRILRYAGMAAAIVLIFLGGLYSATYIMRPSEEIVLLTAKDNASEFFLPDGSRVWLNGESRMKYAADFSGKIREVELTGEAFFKVTKNPQRPFRVRMKDLQIEVLGTSFDAIGYPSASRDEIILRTGSVKISGADFERPVLLKPNEKFSLDHRTGLVSVEPVDARNYCRWFKPELIFDNTPLKDIITNLERRYNIEITLSTRIPAGKRLSMVVCREPLENIMEVMSSLIPIRYSIDGNRVLITDK